jgi:hypothetical protein
MRAGWVAVFFYGLFMDANLLRARGMRVLDPQMARVDDFRLRIGARATLVPAPGRTVHGILMWMPADDLQQLYAEPSVSAYVPQAVEVTSSSGERVAATCYNLPGPFQDFRTNREYAQQLRDLAATLGLPPDYLAGIEQAGVEGDNM